MKTTLVTYEGIDLEVEYDEYAGVLAVFAGGVDITYFVERTPHAFSELSKIEEHRRELDHI